ncbi:DUF935 domain-containing protein [Neisseria sp. Ec49-e6-T10]|uniref:DUF935 domain-containing protein n=1 Tax=Neisseria sp. Ec49-e6-T10 TaxID=3140744 RepID=UPI003EBA4447
MNIKQLMTAILSRSDKTSAGDKMPAKNADLEGGQIATLIQQPKFYGDHPSKGLTPAKLHQILEDAEQGDITAQHELFADMEEKDGHIFAEMSKRKRALTKCDWRICPPKNPTAQEKALADEVNEWLNGLSDFEEVMFDVLDAVGHGFSALEIQWAREENIWLPKQFNHRPQSWFMINDAQEIRLKSNSPEGEALWPFGWFIHTHKARSGQIARAGLHRTLAWPYLFKNFSVKDLAEFLEVYGLPTRIGRYPVNATEKERLALFNAITSIGHNAGGIIPDSMAIEFQAAAAGSHDPFEAMTKWCEKTASKVIVGSTLTSEADGKTSTNALGMIHNEVRHDILESDAKQLAGSITRHLIAPLVQLNKGQINQNRLPYLEFDIRKPEDLSVYADSLPKLVSIGVKIPESWARDKLAIPAPVDDEPVLGIQQPEASIAVNGSQYRQVALSKTIDTNYQGILDQVKFPDQDLNNQIAPLVAQISSALGKGASFDEGIAILNSLQADLDADVFREVMARALFVSDVWGRLNEQN